MLRAIRPADGLRFGLFLLATTIALTAVMTDPADARGRRKRFKGPAYNPPYAALVVDANSGNVLHNANADAQRHPASLTKIMTLYLLFEQIEAGKLRLELADGGLRPRLAAGALQARTASGPDAHASRTRSARWSPSRRTTRPSWSPKRSAATKRPSPG